MTEGVVALIGDVGATNIRLELVLLGSHSNQFYQTLSKATYLVADYHVFEDALVKFLKTSQRYPIMAVLGMAGTIVDNTVVMSNVPQWQTIDGDKIGEHLKIKYFHFINDFEAAAYGILLVPDTDFISLNGKKVNENKLRGVMGPGTGLGSCTIFPANIHHKQFFILPSEGGHTDNPAIGSEASNFFQFLRENTTHNYISSEQSFCGPAIPYIFKFFAQQQFQNGEIVALPSSEDIIAKAVTENPPKVYQETFSLFLKLYASAMGNFLMQHMCTGGLYLVGSLTNSIVGKIKEVDFLEQFKVRHPKMAHIISEVPLVVCKQIDLGLKGAYFYASSIAVKDLPV